MTSARDTDARGTVMPPVPAGTERARSLRDAPALAWLSVVRYAHGARKAPTWPSRLLLTYLTVVATVAWPVLLLPWAVYNLRDRWTVIYVDRTPSGQIAATLTIRARAERRWQVGDHTTRLPGTGAGQRLRSRITPDLIDEADRCGITVEAVAATGGLAAAYTSSIPGLVDIGPARPFGRRLRRVPTRK